MAMIRLMEVVSKARTDMRLLEPQGVDRCP